MKQLHTYLAITVLALLPTTLRFSHGSCAPQEPKNTAPNASNQRPGEADALLAGWLLMASNHEVALAGLAQQKAESADVKQFAQMMVGDHGRMAQQLKPFADGVMRDRGAGAAGRANEREGAGRQQPPADASGTRQAVPMPGLDHQALLRDLGKKCLDAETNLLNEKTGAEFDRCYLRMQVVAHAKAAAMTEVFAGYASEQLRPILDEGHKTLRAHLEQSKALCLQLEKAEKAPKAEKTEKAEKVGGGK